MFNVSHVSQFSYIYILLIGREYFFKIFKKSFFSDLRGSGGRGEDTGVDLRAEREVASVATDTRAEETTAGRGSSTGGAEAIGRG